MHPFWSVQVPAALSGEILLASRTAPGKRPSGLQEGGAYVLRLVGILQGALHSWWLHTKDQQENHVFWGAQKKQNAHAETSKQTACSPYKSAPESGYQLCTSLVYSLKRPHSSSLSLCSLPRLPEAMGNS